MKTYITVGIIVCLLGSELSQGRKIHQIFSQKTSKPLLNTYDEASTCSPPFFPTLCRCIGSSDMICEDFSEFSQLDFSNVVNDPMPREFKQIAFYPAASTRLGDNLNVNSLQLKEQSRVYLNRIDAFYFSSNPFIDFGNKSLILDLTDSNLNFLYDFDQPLNSPTGRCNLVSLSTNNNPIFTGFSEIYFSHNVTFSKQLCPFIFNNVLLDVLVIKEINSLNPFEFLQVGRVSLNSRIRRLEIDSSDISTLNTLFLDGEIFSNIEGKICFILFNL